MSRIASLPTVRRSVAAVLVFAGLALPGCTSSHPPSRAAPDTDQTWTASETEARLQAAADRWENVPHEWGGTSAEGVDCSGLIQSVFEEEFQLSVPRTTEQQSQVGRVVSRSALQPGDLVFFRIESKKRHVGIYLSDGSFLHASASEGVTISSLDRSYWADRWWHARRLLQFEDESSEPLPDSTTRANSNDEVGW